MRRRSGRRVLRSTRGRHEIPLDFGTIALIAFATPLAAQLRVETGGGQAHLDQLPASSLTALGGSIDAMLDHTRLQFAGNAEDHIGLGVAGLMSGGLHYRVHARGMDYRGRAGQ